jgi:two-component system sensor histidine kinase GlrK
VLRNLIGNAVKFTPHGGRIVIRGRPTEEGVQVAVEDTGPGIPAVRRATVFEKFNGWDHKSGTGLGLAIVKHIIGAHGGRVWVESGNGRGSTFVFVLAGRLTSLGIAGEADS